MAPSIAPRTRDAGGLKDTDFGHPDKQLPGSARLTRGLFSFKGRQMATIQQDPNLLEQGQEQAPAGYTIEIEVAGDGSITVSTESAQTEGGEMGEAQEPAGEPVADIREALKKVLAIYQNNGQAPEPADAEQSAAADAFGAARQGR